MSCMLHACCVVFKTVWACDYDAGVGGGGGVGVGGVGVEDGAVSCGGYGVWRMEDKVGVRWRRKEDFRVDWVSEGWNALDLF